MVDQTKKGVKKSQDKNKTMSNSVCESNTKDLPKGKSKNVIVVKISRKIEDIERWKAYVTRHNVNIDSLPYTHIFADTIGIKCNEYNDAICEGVSLIVRKKHCRDVNVPDPPKWIMEILEHQMTLSSFTFTPKKNDDRLLSLIRKYPL
jgi:hypothetical protein